MFGMNEQFGAVAGVGGVVAGAVIAATTAAATATAATTADIDTAAATTAAATATTATAAATAAARAVSNHCVGVTSPSFPRLLIVFLVPALGPLINLTRLHPMPPNVLMIQLIHDDHTDSNHTNILVRPSGCGLVDRMQ